MIKLLNQNPLLFLASKHFTGLISISSHDSKEGLIKMVVANYVQYKLKIEVAAFLDNPI